MKRRSKSLQVRDAKGTWSRGRGSSIACNNSPLIYVAPYLGNLLASQIYFQAKLFLPDPIANDVKYQVTGICAACVDMAGATGYLIRMLASLSD
jgi:hypothetical protein